MTAHLFQLHSQYKGDAPLQPEMVVTTFGCSCGCPSNMITTAGYSEGQHKARTKHQRHVAIAREYEEETSRAS